jgi:hypothetical protein
LVVTVLVPTPVMETVTETAAASIPRLLKIGFDGFGEPITTPSGIANEAESFTNELGDASCSMW